MKIEIWSDVMCPFCYIGKRKFEAALDQFPEKDMIHVEWKSFQLMPELKTASEQSLEDILVERKGLSREQVQAMNRQVTQTAHQVGLEFNLNKSRPANTFKAHRFLHFAKTQGKQNEGEEALFNSYFTKGENIDDNNVLLAIGDELGLNPEALIEVLNSDLYDQAVTTDISEASELGIRGVPFFVFNRKAAVSGAQDPSTFLQALQQTYAEWKEEHKVTRLDMINDGTSCTVDGNCD